MRACILTILSLVVLYLTNGVEGTSVPTCMIGAARLDCLIRTEAECLQANCCWSPPPFNVTDGPTTDYPGTPWCYVQQELQGGYKVESITQGTPSGAPGWVITLQLWDAFNLFGQGVDNLVVTIAFETIARVRVTIRNPDDPLRWEVPSTLVPFAPLNTSLSMGDANYEVSWTDYPFGIAVVRVEDSEVLFNSTPPVDAQSGQPNLFSGIVWSDQYMEITTVLPPSPTIYGLGEKEGNITVNTQGRPMTFFARDAPTPYNQNIYGTHPMYLENRIGEDGKSRMHGVWLRNSNGMDVITRDSVASGAEVGFMQWRVIGGIFDFFFFVGASGSDISNDPESIVSQYQQAVGLPHMPPLWSIGFHQCRWGYHNLSEIEEVVAKFAEFNLPLDVAYSDIDYMNKYEDFTTDPINFPEGPMASFVQKLHQNGKHWVLIIDPGIHNRTGYFAYEEGLQQGVFALQANGEVFIGDVWPGTTAFPAFSTIAYTDTVQDWWTSNIATFRKIIPVDGLWIDMDEASNFCDGDCDHPSGPAASARASPQVETKKHKRGKVVATENVKTSHGKRQPHRRQYLGFNPNLPPYTINNGFTGLPLNHGAIDMDVTHGSFLEYNVHNLFGHSESMATREALETTMGTRAFVLTRSSFSGTGAHAGHFLGDNWSEFESMAMNIPTLMSLNWYGVPHSGAELCGFNGNTTEELCARWMAMGAFEPFSRNHNVNNGIPQEPYRWPSVANITRKAMGVRYTLIHYFNTLFYTANQQGGTVFRPMFFNYNQDPVTWTIQAQFMIGSGILVTPVLEGNVTTVEGYFPLNDNNGTPALFYDWWTQAPLAQSGWVTLDAPIDTVRVHIAGGVILPCQDPGLSTVVQASNHWFLIVAPNSDKYAWGKLFLDNGEQLKVGMDALQCWFEYDGKQFQYIVSQNDYQPAGTLNWTRLSILGVTAAPKTISTPGGLELSYDWNPETQVLSVGISPTSLNTTWELNFTW